jgi:FKBP-type peptidyl-prolyl cis-trans isomerase FkpA
MAARMNSLFRAVRRLTAAMALPLLAAPFPVAAATVPKAKAPATAPRPLAANNSIIPLPLAPVVPAAQRLCATRTASGLGYTMLRPASGPKPTGDDTVLINYVGYLASEGAVFDQGMRSPLPVDEVIPGFSEGLQLMARTGVIRLCIPAAMGYGARESGPIPANSDLVFQVELLDFKTAAELEAMRKAQAAERAPQENAPPKP